MSEDTEGIEYLIDKGAEINRNDLLGENALMYVIQNQNMPTEEKLNSVASALTKVAVGKLSNNSNYLSARDNHA